MHSLEPQPRRDKLEGGQPITIGDNVWLGGGVIVCPDVTIGENSVICAGAVVTKDSPPTWWASATRPGCCASSEARLPGEPGIRATRRGVAEVGPTWGNGPRASRRGSPDWRR